jgi:hypothetical protein
MGKGKKYVPLTEGWVGKKPFDTTKKIIIDMSKIRPINRVIIDPKSTRNKENEREP